MEELNKTKIISHEKINRMFEEEAEFGKYKLDWIKETEFDNHLYSVYKDRKSGNYYAIEKSRFLHMGFNSNEPGTEDEFLRIMKVEGRCRPSWGVTGRTAHMMLAEQLAAKYPQFRWEIGYNYKCEAFDDHRLVLQPGFEPEVLM